MEKMRVGKIRGLQQISNSHGIFAMCAMDHRGSLKKMINPADPKSVGYDRMVEQKQELCETLGPHSSAVLLDPDYGAAHCILGNNLPGQAGLLVSMEATGYSTQAEGRITELLQGWNAAKIRRMGGAAGKLLLYYRPDIEELAAKQRDVVREAAAECEQADLTFLVEPKTYAIGDEVGNPGLLADRLPRLVIDTAREITELDIDVLKAEFPADMDHEKDEGKLLDVCRQLDEASRVPWVVLSAGVSYDVFAKQVEIACRAGASGFLGGRAIWQEAIGIPDKTERLNYLRTTVADRMKRLAEIANEYGTPWHMRTGAPVSAASQLAEKWYKAY